MTGDKCFLFLYLFLINDYAMSCEGSVVLTQTHPAASYVCRTGNITFRCQYDGVQGVASVVWLIGLQTTTNPSTIQGHTALPRTATYQEVVVDSYINLAAGYRCEPTFGNGSQLRSAQYIPQTECECYILQHNLVDSHIPIHIIVCFLPQVELMIQS